MLTREYRIQKSATPAETAEKADEIPHELTNIRVQEVSLVDRAANRRKFLITKRDKRKNDDTVVVDEADLVDLTLTAKAELPGADLDRRDAEKAREEREAEARAESEREKKIAAGVTKNEPPAEEKKEPPAAEPPAKDPPAKEQDPDKTPVVTPEKPAEAPSKPQEAVEIVEQVQAKAQELVEKVGRPMRRERLDRLKAAAKALADILGELDVEEEAPAAKADPAPVVAKETPAPAAVTPPAPAPAPVVVDTAKADAMAAEIKRLSTMVETLQNMVKDNATQLAKSRQTVDSNTISLEKANSDRDKVYWGMDLAAPESRLKGRSF